MELALSANGINPTRLIERPMSNRNCNPLNRKMGIIYTVAWAKKMDFGFSLWRAVADWSWESPKKFQIYRPINDTWQAISIFNGNFNEKVAKKNDFWP